MECRKEENGWLIFLKKGEEIRSSLASWAKKEKISGAYFWGIGGITDVELGFFDKERNVYLNRKFEGDFELLTCMGDITEDGVHAHVTISGSDFTTLGGHLQHATISVFGEFLVSPTDFIGRTPDAPTGLKRLDLGKKF
jgi:predicted DNA-binding protein with PD1-like motif